MPESDEKSDLPPTPRDGIHTELIDKVHKANEQFKEARKEVEKAMDAEIDSLEHRQDASRRLADAEEQVEKADEGIRPEFKKTDEAKK